jgi:hypothetical protein
MIETIAMPWQDILDGSEERQVHDLIIDLTLDQVEGREARPRR